MVSLHQLGVLSIFAFIRFWRRRPCHSILSLQICAKSHKSWTTFMIEVPHHHHETPVNRHGTFWRAIQHKPFFKIRNESAWLLVMVRERKSIIFHHPNKKIIQKNKLDKETPETTGITPAAQRQHRSNSGNVRLICFTSTPSAACKTNCLPYKDDVDITHCFNRFQKSHHASPLSRISPPQWMTSESHMSKRRTNIPMSRG